MASATEAATELPFGVLVALAISTPLELWGILA